MNESIQEYCKKGTFPPRTILEKKFKCPVIVVYHSPTDFHGKYVARIWDVEDGQPVPRYFIVKNTLEEIKREIPAGMTWFMRDDDDDPYVVGTYI